MNYNKNLSIDNNISNICKNEYQFFLNKKGVVGVGLGYKMAKGFYTQKKCITVFVRKKLPQKLLSNENIIPKCYKGFKTDVIESGVFKFNSLTSRIRPVINGYSIGNILGTNSGTCACLVHDKYLYILSTNHVLALNNTAPKESVILQPGTDDGGTIQKDVIGHLYRSVPIKLKRGLFPHENVVDCAICKVINRSFVSPNIAFLGMPQGIDKPYLNQDVQKVGKTTELTHGKIINLSATITIEVPVQKFALFKNQIISTPMSDNGDSGSLLLNNNIYALGLLMGGSNQRTLYNPIDEVLKALKVELVTNKNVLMI